jgi:hypothetical protein
MTMVISGSDGITFPDSTTQNTTDRYGFVNRIINGDMRIDQRNNGASVNADAATNPYTCDRWRSLALTGSGQFSVQQSTTAPTGFTNSLLFTSLAATSVGVSDAFGFRQPIEGLNCSDFGFGTASAQTVTLSFWVRSSLTGTFGGSLANNSANRSYPFSYTISAANTFEYKTITIPGDTTGTWATNNAGGINVWFGLGVGATRSGTAGVWAGSDFRSATGSVNLVSTNGATFYITGVQLEVGSVATPFERRPYGTELALCQRYCKVWTSTAMGQAISNQLTNSGTLYFPTTMRSAPTLSGASFTVTTGSAGTPDFVYITENSAWVYNVSSNWTNGANVRLTATASSEL